MSLGVRERYSNPLSKAQRKMAYAFLSDRDGEKCQICGKTVEDVELVVHHRDGNTKNNSPSNLSLLCRADNEKEVWRNRLSYNATTHRSVSVKMDVKDEPESREGERNTALIKQEFLGSEELRLNRLTEPMFRSYIANRLLTQEREIPLKTAINDGAEKCSCSPITARRYLEKMTSNEGAYTILKIDKRLFVTLKQSFKK